MLYPVHVKGACHKKVLLFFFSLCHITALPISGCTSHTQHPDSGQKGEGHQVGHDRIALVKVTDRYVMDLDGLYFVSLLLLVQGFQVAQGECDLFILKLL